MTQSGTQPRTVARAAGARATHQPSASRIASLHATRGDARACGVEVRGTSRLSTPLASIRYYYTVYAITIRVRDLCNPPVSSLVGSCHDFTRSDNTQDA